MFQDRLVPFNQTSGFDNFDTIKQSIVGFFQEKYPNIKIVDVTMPIRREKGLCGLIKTELNS